MSLRLFATVCASIWLGFGPANARSENSSTESAVPDAAETSTAESTAWKQQEVLRELRRQTVLRESQRLISAGHHDQAIEHLESHLTSADGNEKFLAALEQAYRERLEEHLRQHRPEEAQRIAQRLRVLTSHNIPEVNEELAAAAEGSPTSRAGKAKPSVSARESGLEKGSPAKRSERSAPTPVAQLLEPKPIPPKSTTPKPGKSERNPKPTPKPTGNAPTSRATQAKPESTTKSTKPTKPSYVARGKLVDRSVAERSVDQAREALVLAEGLYRERKFPEALAAYEEAYDLDPAGEIQAARNRYGYSLLFVSFRTFETLERQVAFEPEEVSNLEADIRLAKRLVDVPKCQRFADDLLMHVHRLHAGPTEVPRATPASFASNDRPNHYTKAEPAKLVASTFRHLPNKIQSWSVAETRNFRILHRNANLAEEVARIAERVRAEAHAAWFPTEPLGDWTPKCEIVLYPTAREYAMATGVGPQSPGHAKVLNENGHIRSRRVELRVDEPDMRRAVLPHELTHVVLAGRFGSHNLPRWADEGMAVLTEPEDKQVAHLDNLERCRRSGSGFSCRQILTMGEYPPGNRMRDFYAHSVGIVSYLVERGGRERLVRFLRSALDGNDYAGALRAEYGVENFRDLEMAFNDYVAGGAPAIASAR